MSYITTQLDALPHLSAKLERGLQILRSEIQFDGFICTGVSGILLGSAMRLLFDQQVLIVRKSKAHCKETIVGHTWNKAAHNLVFLDDFVDSGATLERVQDAAQVHLSAKIVACLFPHVNPNSGYEVSPGELGFKARELGSRGEIWFTTGSADVHVGQHRAANH